MSKSEGQRLPDDWNLPLEWEVWAETYLPKEEVLWEAEKFHDYWISACGAGARKRNWYATWRNWIRKVVDSKPRGRAKGPGMPLWQLSDDTLVGMARERGISTQGRSRKDLERLLGTPGAVIRV